MGARNINGGNRAKRQGRKHQGCGGGGDEILRKSISEMEKYGVITKMCGGNLCKVITEDGKELCCHMGGKFRGRNKRQNYVEIGKWVLIGLREWEKTSENCDLEYVYDRDEIEQLRGLPGINLKHLINQDNIMNNISQESSIKDLESELGFVFSDTIVSKTDINNIISGNVGNVVVHHQSEEINIDDL